MRITAGEVQSGDRIKVVGFIDRECGVEDVEDEDEFDGSLFVKVSLYPYSMDDLPAEPGGQHHELFYMGVFSLRKEHPVELTFRDGKPIFEAPIVVGDTVRSVNGLGSWTVIEIKDDHAIIIPVGRNALTARRRVPLDSLTLI